MLDDVYSEQDRSMYSPVAREGLKGSRQRVFSKTEIIMPNIIFSDVQQEEFS